MPSPTWKTSSSTKYVCLHPSWGRSGQHIRNPRVNAKERISLLLRKGNRVFWGTSAFPKRDNKTDTNYYHAMIAMVDANVINKIVELGLTLHRLDQ